METTATRLKKAMSLRNIRQVDLVEKTKISKGALSSYIAGRYTPKQNNLYLLAKALDVNEAWLMGLNVPMERDNNEDQNIIRYDAEFEDACNLLSKAGYIVDYSEETRLVLIKMPNKETVSIMEEDLVNRYENLYKANKLSANNLVNFSGASSFDNIDLDFKQMNTILARNGKKLTAEEKNELIKILLSDD